MGTNCAPLVADLFMFCYERDFLMSFSDDKQVDIIDAFNTTSRYLDDILNTNNVYLDTMVIESEYDQKIPQSQTADNPKAPRGRATQPSRDTRKTNKAKQPALSSPSR